MSKILELIKEEPFKFVIPTPGKCFKSRISKRDKVLLLVLNKGYKIFWYRLFVFH